MLPRLLIAGLLASCAALAPCQEVSGSMNGAVRDAGGAHIVGAEVTATHLETGAARTSKTDSEGAYVFTALPIGAYRIEAQHPGFKRAVRASIELHLGDHLSVDLNLDIGGLAQEISVVGDAPQVQTETSEQSGLISGEQVRELQLNGRSFMTLVELLPGVSSDMPDRVDPNTPPALSINGGRSSSNSFQIDGGSNSDVIVGGGSLNTFTSVETIAEFKVLTSTFSAEYGRGGFTQINVVTRGGTRKLRGSLYHFFRNDVLDARDYFTHQVLPLKLNNFGYNLGGPLVIPGVYNRDRKKTFFFFTQEFNRISTRGEAINTTVPTLAERQGDFSGRGPGRDRIWETEDDPVIDPETGVGFPGGIIPASRLDPNALKIVQLYPLPNFRGPGAINFTSAAPSQLRWREDLIRIDQNFASWKIYGRYAQDSSHVWNPYGGWNRSTVTTRFPGLSTTDSTVPGKNLTVNMTKLFSRNLLNETIFTYAARRITQNPVSDVANRAKLGVDIPELFPENNGNVIPTISLGSNYATLNVARVWLKKLFHTELTNNLSKVLGRHIFKTGAIFAYGGNRENAASPNTNGSFSFTTAFSKNPVANLLLGLPFSYTEAERFVVSHARFAMLEAYIQDDIRATPRLTLNPGLRISNYFNPWDTMNVLTNFLPESFDQARAPRIDSRSGQRVPDTGDALNGLIIAGKNSPYGKRITNNNTLLLGPRFGFAYDLFGNRKTALRAGYGIYYTRPLIGTFINNAFDNPPFSRSVTIQQPPLSDPAEGRTAPQGAVNLTALAAPLRAPTIHQWSVGVQQEVRRQAIVGVSYVASRGVRLMRPFNLNNPEPGLASAQGVHVNFVRPYRGFGNITQRQSTASSIYHSLQVTVNRRFTRGLSFGTAYTFSKSIDDGSSDRGGSDIPPDSRNPRTERGPSDFDRKHILTANFIWNLPRLAPAKTGLVNTFLNGWQMSGITRFFSGAPFDVQLSSDVANIGATQNQRPDVIENTRGPRTVEQWFNRYAFARPATGTFGNLGRNSMRRPGVNKWDLSMFKNFSVERRQLQFRAEFFNTWNHPSFTTLGTSLNTTSTAVNPAANSFAVITGTRDARVLQFALKLMF